MSWINIKHELPEKDPWKVYAVLTNQDNLRKHQIAWFNHSDKTFRLENYPDKPLKVTYWMELPHFPHIINSELRPDLTFEEWKNINRN